MDLNYDFKTVNNLIKAAVMKKFLLGVFDDRHKVVKNPKVEFMDLTERVKNGYYNSEFSGLELHMVYIQPSITQTGQPNVVKFDRTFILFYQDTNVEDFPLVMEAKLFGTNGKPCVVAVDKESGDVYLVYMKPSESFEMLHFGTLSKLSKDIVIDDDFLEVRYEFGIDNHCLYKYVTRDEGWAYLRNNMYIQFNGVTPTIKLKVGTDDSEVS